MEEKLLTLNSKTNLDCKICNRCCMYRGDIKLTPITVIEVSKYLKIPINEFIEKYTETLEGEPPEMVIKAVGEDRRCIFNDNTTFKCNIHKYRPIQCVMFPLYPVDIENNIFINMNTCIKKSDKKTKVSKWLNGEKIYDRNKTIYLKWVDMVEEIQSKWEKIPEGTQKKIRFLLFQNYDLKKRNYQEQILDNFKKVREIIYG